MNSTLKTVLKIVAIVLAIAAVVGAVIGVVACLKRKKEQSLDETPGPDYPEEYADYADVPDIA